jgi:hypothetical protein
LGELQAERNAEASWKGCRHWLRTPRLKIALAGEKRTDVGEFWALAVGDFSVVKPTRQWNNVIMKVQTVTPHVSHPEIKS